MAMDYQPRYAVIPAHNRPEHLIRCVASLADQVDRIFIVDNASDPPIDVPRNIHHNQVVIVREPEQPPNLSKNWNIGLAHVQVMAQTLKQTQWDVGIFNDDTIVPTGWFHSVATAMRNHPTALVAHTHTYGDQSRASAFYDANSPMILSERMCPWAFVTRGEMKLRSDERLRWWWFDTDFEVRARQLGGVLAIPGPPVPNTAANASTVGELAEQAGRDREMYATIHGSNPW
jgi:glycosyltransferase involved in cell wall biosynthesis